MAHWLLHALEDARHTITRVLAGCAVNTCVGLNQLLDHRWHAQPACPTKHTTTAVHTVYAPSTGWPVAKIAGQGQQSAVTVTTNTCFQLLLLPLVTRDSACHEGAVRLLHAGYGARSQGKHP
jgi:hypothetical protein